MPDGDVDDFVKEVTNLIDEWGGAIKKIAKELADIQAEIDKMEQLKKDRLKLTKDVDDESKALSRKIMTLKLPPKADPKQATKLPSVITKYVDKNGLILGDYGSLKPMIDIDLKKMEVKKVGITWTWKF